MTWAPLEEPREPFDLCSMFGIFLFGLLGIPIICIQAKILNDPLMSKWGRWIIGTVMTPYCLGIFAGEILLLLFTNESGTWHQLAFNVITVAGMSYLGAVVRANERAEFSGSDSAETNGS